MDGQGTTSIDSGLGGGGRSRSREYLVGFHTGNISMKIVKSVNPGLLSQLARFFERVFSSYHWTETAAMGHLVLDHLSRNPHMRTRPRGFLGGKSHFFTPSKNSVQHPCKNPCSGFARIEIRAKIRAIPGKSMHFFEG